MTGHIKSLEEVSQEETELTPIDRVQYYENIGERYDGGLVDGIQNETIQNSVDGFEQNDLDSVTIQLTYDPENRTFEWRDNAGGMPFKTLKGSFLAFESGDKSKGQFRGSRGQGSAVFLNLGQYVGVEVLHDGERHTGFWDSETGERNFDTWKSEELVEEGTRVVVDNVKDEHHDDLCDIELVESLIHKWWERTIRRNDVEIIYRVKGQEERVIEPLDMSEAEHQRYNNIHVDGAEDIDTLDIYYFEDGRPSEFDRVCALNVKGHTIQWTTPHGIDGQNKVVAFAEIDGMYKYEKPAHRGFKGAPITSVRQAIKKEISQYAQRKLNPQDEVDESVDEGLEKAKELASEVLGDVGGFDFLQITSTTTGKGNKPNAPGGGTTPTSPTEEPDDPYCSKLEIGERDREKGDVITPDIHIKNPKSKTYNKEDLKMQVQFLYPDGHKETLADSIIEQDGEGVYVKGGKTVKPNNSYSFTIPEDGPDGRYRIRVIVIDKSGKSNKFQTKASWVRVGIESQPRGGTQEVSQTGVNDVVLYESEEDEDTPPVERKKSQINDEGTVFLNRGYPGWEQAVEEDEDGETVLEYAYTAIIQKAIDKKMNRLVDKRENEEISLEEYRDELSNLQQKRDYIEAYFASREV